MSDRDKIIHDDKWPAWPLLPVKRGDMSLKNKNLGVLYATKEFCAGKMTVFHVNLFDLPEGSLRDVPQTSYESVEAMLADGWQVD